MGNGLEPSGIWLGPQIDLSGVQAAAVDEVAPAAPEKTRTQRTVQVMRCRRTTLERARRAEVAPRVDTAADTPASNEVACSTASSGDAEARADRSDVVGERVPPGPQRRQSGGVGGGAGEHAVEGAVGTAGRDTCLDRLELGIDSGKLKDRLGELEPRALARARQVQHARRAGLDRLQEGGREVACVGRAQPLVRHHPERAAGASPLDHPGDEVAALRGAPVEAEEGGAPYHDRTGSVGERALLARQLGDGVDAPRLRAVELRIRLAPRAGEDVVRAEMDEPRSRLGAALREALHGTGVHLERAVLLALADLDVVEGGAVEDDLGTHPLEDPPDGVVVRDVELRPGRGGKRRGARGQEHLQVRGKLPFAAGYQDPVEAHNTDPKRSIRG